MRDPGLVAVDLVDVALAHGAGLQRGEIGAGIGLGEHRGRQHLAGGDLRQPLALLLFGAAAENELGGDLGTGAEAADADIAARQLLGDHAHQFLAEPHAAVVLGDGQREHAELGHLPDDIERNVLVAQMPSVRLRHHLVVGELAHFLADRIERVVEAAGADGRLVLQPDQLDQPGAARRGVAERDQVLDRRRHARRRSRGRKAEVGETHDLALAHGNAAEDLRQIFAGADAHQKLLDLAEIAARRQPFGIGRELAQRLDIGREPSETVGGALFAVERPRNRAAVLHHPLGDRPARVREQGVDGRNRLAERRDQLVAGGLGGCGKRHK